MSVAETRDTAPVLAMPPRAARPLSTVQILKVGLTNSLSACDEEMFDELIVERRFFGRPAFVISDPDGVRRVLQDNYDNYPRLDQSRRIFHFGSGTGMLCAEGDPWRRHRRLINPTLDYRAIQADMPALVSFVEDVAQRVAAVPVGEAIDIGKAAAQFISAATCHLFAGGDPRIGPFVEELAHYPGKLSLFDVLPVPQSLGFVARYFGGRAVAQQFEPMLRELITERRRPDYAGSQDMLWRLTQARDRTTGDSLSDDELCDEAFTLANTAVTPLRVLSWIWYLLALHPAIEQRLHAELNDVLGGRNPVWEDLQKLVYLRQVVDETMRLYPPLPVMMRTVAEDDAVCGWRIPRGAMVTIAPWVIHRHRKLWAAPDRFDPDRFNAEATAARSRYEYIPFSIGPHICTGAPLSLVEIVTAVAILAQRFRFYLVPGHPIEPVGWTSLRPARGIRVTVERRESAAGRH
jgi:cytochrome P450